jgi:uracil-DNA glycosylase family 4
MLPLPYPAPTYNKEEILRLIDDLDTCPLKNSGIRVVHPVGDGSSKVFIIGEAPGAKEDQLGEPFVGASGKFLNNTLLPSIGLSRDNIYLTNIVKCRPPENRDPTDIEKAAWTPVLLSEIAFQRPEVIICLGRHSLGFFLPDVKISHVHGKPQTVKVFEDLSVQVLPMYHPAVALYNPGQRETLVKDMGQAMQFLPKDLQAKAKLSNQQSLQQIKNKTTKTVVNLQDRTPKVVSNPKSSESSNPNSVESKNSTNKSNTTKKQQEPSSDSLF